MGEVVKISISAMFLKLMILFCLALTMDLANGRKKRQGRQELWGSTIWNNWDPSIDPNLRGTLQTAVDSQLRLGHKSHLHADRVNKVVNRGLSRTQDILEDVNTDLEEIRRQECVKNCVNHGRETEDYCVYHIC